MNNHEQQSPQNPEREPHPALAPRVWIGSLADYNAGNLVGDWIDAAVSADQLYEGARSILARSREPAAEEWAIFDYDEFGSYRVNEYDDLAQVAFIARGIAVHGAAFSAWAELVRDDSPELLNPPNEQTDAPSDDEFSGFTERFLGSYPSRADWAEEMAHDLAGDLEAALPAWLAPYVRIAWDDFARDCALGGEFEFAAHDDGVWVFDGRV